MLYEKIFKHADGSRVQVFISFDPQANRCDQAFYVDRVYVCAPGKRSFNGVVSSDSYEFRRIPPDERPAYKMAQYLKHITEAEILEVKTEFWQKLKPV